MEAARPPDGPWPLSAAATHYLRLPARAKVWLRLGIGELVLRGAWRIEGDPATLVPGPELTAAPVPLPLLDRWLREAEPAGGELSKLIERNAGAADVKASFYDAIRADLLARELVQPFYLRRLSPVLDAVRATPAGWAWKRAANRRLKAAGRHPSRESIAGLAALVLLAPPKVRRALDRSLASVVDEVAEEHRGAEQAEEWIDLGKDWLERLHELSEEGTLEVVHTELGAAGHHGGGGHAHVGAGHGHGF